MEREHSLKLLSYMKCGGIVLKKKLYHSTVICHERFLYCIAGIACPVGGGQRANGGKNANGRG